MDDITIGIIIGISVLALIGLGMYLFDKFFNTIIVVFIIAVIVSIILGIST